LRGFGNFEMEKGIYEDCILISKEARSRQDVRLIRKCYELPNLYIQKYSFDQSSKNYFFSPFPLSETFQTRNYENLKTSQ